MEKYSLKIFLLLFFSSSYVFASSTYSPHDCEYSVKFPSKPKYTTSFDPSLGEYSRAQYGAGNKDNGFFLRAECIGGLNTKGEKLNTKNFLKKQIVAYVTSNGIQDAEYHYNESELGKSVRARGFKEIRNRMVTYESIIYVGKTSFIMLYTGGVSKKYPQLQVANFLRSLKKTN